MAEVRVRFQRGGLCLQFVGTPALFESSVGPLLSPLDQGRPAPPAVVPEPARPDYEPPRDRFGTFQRQLAVEEENQAQLVAAYAFFLWNYEKREVFSEDEVAGCFAAHGRALPEDPEEIYGGLLSQRVLSPGAAQHTWRLTSKGRDFVRHHLLSA